MGNSYPICGDSLLLPDRVVEQNDDGKLTELPQEIKASFDITGRIGHGTTSTVFLAIRRQSITTSDPSNENIEWLTENGHANRLACKVVDKVMEDRDHYEREFLLRKYTKEIEILRKLDHPNIIQYSSMLETHRNMYIFMEYLPGGQLFDYLYHHGPIADLPAGRMVHGVISAVAYMHELGIVHRDIKAENLMLVSTDCPDNLRVKLIDFGYSTTLSRLSATDSFLGSPGYLAPEIRQHRSYSKTVDIWAVGVLIHLVLCCRLPFEIEVTDLSTDRKEMRGRFELTFIEKEWRDTDTSSAQHLLNRMLDVDQATRYTAFDCLRHPWLSAQRLGDDFTQVNSGVSTHDSAPALGSLPRKEGPNHWAASSLGSMGPNNPETTEEESDTEAGGGEIINFGMPLSMSPDLG